MCDYSLMGIPSRLAREDDELAVYQFPTGSRGLTPCSTAPGEESNGWFKPLRALLDAIREEVQGEKLAVCIPPGARLFLRDIPMAIQRVCQVGREEEVTFTQLSAKEYEYRDAVRFANGREILLQQLREGQRVRVLELSGSEETPEPVSEKPEFGFPGSMLGRARLDFIAPRVLAGPALEEQGPGRSARRTLR